MMLAPEHVLVIELRPWLMFKILFLVVAVLAFGYLAITVLTMLRRLAYTVFLTVTGPLRVYRGEVPADEAEPANGGGNRMYGFNVVFGDDDEDREDEEPPPNQLWPPEDRFNDNH